MPPPRSPLAGKILQSLLLVPVVFAAGSLERPAAGRSLEGRITEQQQQLHRLNRGIEEQKSRLIDSRQRENNLLVELERLEQQLEEDGRQLFALQDQMKSQEARLAAEQAKLDQLLLEQQDLALQVKKRLAAYYRTGEVGYLNVLFSTSSIYEIQNVEEYFKRLVRHDQQVIAGFRQKVAEVTAAHQALAQEKMALAALLDEHRQREQATAVIRQQHIDLLRMVLAEKRLYQLAVQEMEKDALRLTAAFDKLREESLPPRLERKQEPPPNKERPEVKEGEDFAAQKGLLPPPVAGEVIIGFGQEIPGRFGITTRAAGIGIKTEAGAQIRAIFPGKIAYSGYIRGYGNLLIIDHGRQYYSLMARAAIFLKEKGSDVQAGEVVGMMGDKSQLPADGLHFEIRHGSAPENPLFWLDRARLIMAAGQEQAKAPDVSALR